MSSDATINNAVVQSWQEGDFLVFTKKTKKNSTEPEIVRKEI